MALLQASRIFKSFADSTVLRDVSFQVDRGEIVCLLGPSGCGKTTLLRIIAGLETADSGTVTFDGRDMQAVPVQERGFGLMFQDCALFPHKNVWQNVIFGLRMQSLPPDQIKRQAQAAMTLVGLSGFEQRDVNELSGGEKQRVALARSLAHQPKLLMLDEPLGSLDRKLREELMIELRRILKDGSLTSIYVTHDQQEAFAIADRVVIMNAGQIEQVGAPREVYVRPASKFVARFLGLPNLLTGTVVTRSAGVAVIRTSIGHLHAGSVSPDIQSGQAVTLLIRPDAASIEADPFVQAAEMEAEWFAETPQANVLDGTLIEASFRGRYNRVVVRVNNVELVFELGEHTKIPPKDQHVRVALRDDSIVVLS